MNLNADEQLLRLSNPRVHADDQTASFRVERQDEAALDVWCPLVELGDIVQFLCGLAAYASTEQDSQSQHPAQAELAPIPAKGIGFATGRSADTANIVIQLSGLALAFEVSSSALIAMAGELSRIATTLSASQSRPQ